MPKIEAKCEQCGKIRLMWPSWTMKGKNFFCSRSCKAEFMKNHPNKKFLNSQRMLGKHHTDETKKIQSMVQKGKHYSPDTEYKDQGKHQTIKCAFCTKDIERFNYRFKRLTNKFGTFCNKTCFGKWRSLHQRGEAHPFYGKKHSEETIQKMLTTRNKGLHIHPNKPETLFMEICKKHNLSFNFVGDGELLIGRVNPDFQHASDSKLLVEIFSEYWHNPEKRKLRWHQTYEGRIQYLAEHGYRVLIFWDYELKNEEDIVKKVKMFLGFF